MKAFHPGQFAAGLITRGAGSQEAGRIGEEESCLPARREEGSLTEVCRAEEAMAPPGCDGGKGQSRQASLVPFVTRSHHSEVGTAA